MINKSQLMDTIIVWADELLAIGDKVDKHNSSSEKDKKVRRMNLADFKSKRIEYETMVKLYHWDKEQYDKDVKGGANDEG